MGIFDIAVKIPLLPHENGIVFFSRRCGVGRAVQTLQFVRPIKRIRSGGTTIVAVPRQKGPSECDGIIRLFMLLLVRQ